MTDEIRAEIVANVIETVAHEGSNLQPGDTVLLLESMKMEIPALAETAGRLIRFAVSVGDTVQEGDLLAVLGTDPG